MKSFIAKRVISILVNLRYLRFKLLKYKENNKKICNTFDHNFKHIPLYIMSNVSLERYYFVLYDGALTLKMSKMALNAFCDKTLHMFQRYLQMYDSINGKTCSYHMFEEILFFMPPSSKGTGALIFWDCPSARLSIYPASCYCDFGKNPPEGKVSERRRREMTCRAMRKKGNETV